MYVYHYRVYGCVTSVPTCASCVFTAQCLHAGGGGGGGVFETSCSIIALND